MLANVDGLVDYGEDYTDAACVIEGLQTAYQVGKGMLAHVEEMARQAEAQDEMAAPDESIETPPAPAEEPEPLAFASNDAPDWAPPDYEVPDHVRDGENEIQPPNLNRRMTFHFETTTT